MDGMPTSEEIHCYAVPSFEVGDGYPPLGLMQATSCWDSAGRFMRILMRLLGVSDTDYAEKGDRGHTKAPSIMSDGVGSSSRRYGDAILRDG